MVCICNFILKLSAYYIKQFSLIISLTLLLNTARKKEKKKKEGKFLQVKPKYYKYFLTTVQGFQKMQPFCYIKIKIQEI